MYAYEWDPETGGFLLLPKPADFSKEPRPVYYQELDILGFDKYWNYAKDDSYPYMWAEANNYIYRGRKVALTKGGSLSHAPEIQLIEDPEPDKAPLQFVNIQKMVEKNHVILDSLVQETIKQVYNTYLKYQKKVDVFYVAFSGGKDSVVTMDIVQKALPHNSFKVLFGDTGMEFPDTYDVVEKTKILCENNKIDFITSKSLFPTKYTWEHIGPPSSTMRWCCSVHKTSPQIIELRKILRKSNFTGMAFIGVRASESLARSEYDYISLGEKHKGQYSCNPILDWNSAELYVYIYENDLFLNKTYKKGNRRAGCLLCPKASEKNEYMTDVMYPNEVSFYKNLIFNSYKKNFDNEDKISDFISNGGWKARKNGRDITDKSNYSEKIENNTLFITVINPKHDWKIWIKTIGILQTNDSPYRIHWKKGDYLFSVKEFDNGYEVSIDNALSKKDPLFIKLFKNVFRKSAYCILCQECQADCHQGALTMDDGILQISDICLHCSDCHKVNKGCLVFQSLELPKGSSIMSKDISLNRYSHHAPKIDWFRQYFEFKNEFDQKHSLGSQMYSFFKRFLRDADLLDKDGFSSFAGIIDNLGLDIPDNSSWALMLCNLAYTAQFNWYIKKFGMNTENSRDYVINELISDGNKDTWAKDIWSCFTRFSNLPFSQVGYGFSTEIDGKIRSITRTPWLTPESRVILYSLYKFAEACDGYYQFSLTRLLDHEIDSEGVSPTQIFGLDRETMEKILKGLSVNYPDYITTAFTLDLDTINLNRDKTSADVLSLF